MNSGTRRIAASLLALALIALPNCSSKSKSNPVSPPGPNAFDSGNITGGTNFAHVFATAGSFGYHCAIHPNMTGTVIVDASAPIGNAAVTIVNMTTGFNPSTVSVRPGATVTWTNGDTVTHTVTSN